LLKFDHDRGYGFIAADDGGEDVFLHASVFDGDPYKLAPGRRVEFKVLAGDRGRKALTAHLFLDETESASPGTPAARAVHEEHMPDDEPMCDVLSPAEFGQELTELLLSGAPMLTGQQILAVRQAVLALAGKHGWVDT
jgi:CspA family cold shock protein